MELTCLYKDRWNGEIKDKKFDSYEVFGKWVADNATEIILIDVVQEEDQIIGDKHGYEKSN